MISFQYIDTKLTKQLGTKYANKAHTESERVDYVNSALRYFARSASFPFLVLTYTFTADGTKTTYTTPLRHTTKKIFQGDSLLVQNLDWATPEQYAKNAEDLIGVYADTIVLPEATDTKTYKIEYRGLPTMVIAGNESTYAINLPEDTVDAIIYLAAYYGNNDINEHALGAEKFQLFQIEQERLKAIYGNPSEEHMKIISSGHNFMGPQGN